MAFRDELWAVAGPIYARILEHPFLTSLADGSLPDERFRGYVVQDYHYLRGFSRALALIAAHAPSDPELEFFASSAVNVIAVEHELHQGFLAGFDLTRDDVLAMPQAPTTVAYVNFMRALAGSYVDGVASVLACYWIYRQVGTALIALGSPDPRYQKWIDTYGDEAFAATVDRLLEIVDALSPRLGDEQRARFTELWLRGCRYEWMFWDSAWHEESWPV